MKTKVLLIVLVFSTLAFAQQPRGARIGYVDMEYILENVEEYRDANEQLDVKVEKWKIEIEQMYSSIEQMRKDLLAEKVLLTNELITEREEEISILEKEMLEYQQDRFGPQGDLVLQKQMLVQPIQDQVFSEVQKIAANKKYDFILYKSADVVMLYAEKRFDISDLVLRAIARTRKTSPPKKKENLKKFKEQEAEKPISEALKVRQDKSKDAAAARAKTADEKRAEQAKLREERKKAYEDRRKKLLEEREAKKKGKDNKEKEEKGNN